MAEEAIAKARAIALKLSGTFAFHYEASPVGRSDEFLIIIVHVGGISIGSDLGKRKNRWEEQSGGGVTTAGPGCQFTSISFIPLIFHLKIT